MKVQETIEVWVGSFILDRRIRNVSPGTVGFLRDKLGKFVTWYSNHDLDSVTQISPHDLRVFLIYLEDLGHNAGGHKFLLSSR